MKYMGSKRQMLRNGLGDTLDRALDQAHRFVDLFTGSAAVAKHVAEKYEISVVAVDLQAFCVALAEATLLRERPVQTTIMTEEWVCRAKLRMMESPIYERALVMQQSLKADEIATKALLARELSKGSGNDFCVAYGGWYYSPYQALLLSSLREELPKSQDDRVIALAGLISSASRSAASPGHTAQPFKAETRAGTFVIEAWTRDVVGDLQKACIELGDCFSKRKGLAVVGDAKIYARTLNEGDLVFVDPPYSAVHYSRFYHVLESIARGRVGIVSGSGRYPAIEERPSSQFSIKTKAKAALTGLLSQISDANARAVLTFPLDAASNGLSGNMIRDIATERFYIQQEKVSSRFSTLGGDAKSRTARKDSVELILSLAPKH